MRAAALPTRRPRLVRPGCGCFLMRWMTALAGAKMRCCGGFLMVFDALFFLSPGRLCEGIGYLSCGSRVDAFPKALDHPRQI